MPLCQLENIEKTFRLGDVTVRALRGVHLAVEEGEFIAIMGPSGSGKTTLMNIIGCLDIPTSGRYILEGRDISTLDDDELSTIRNRLIGFVFQNFYLLNYITATENILLPTIYRGENSHGIKERVSEILKMVDLEDRATFKPKHLSGGEQQRVAIARALINNPELILCDEPTGQLDSTTAKEIMEILKKLHENGKTIILITHDLHIARYASKILHIRDGQIVQNH